MENTTVKRVVIDDLRTHPDGGVHLRNSEQALEWLREHRDVRIDELWLDHDLGMYDTIRPVVRWLEEECADGRALNIGAIYVHTGSIVGAKWMMSSNVLNNQYTMIRSYIVEQRL